MSNERNGANERIGKGLVAAIGVAALAALGFAFLPIGGTPTAPIGVAGGDASEAVDLDWEALVPGDDGMVSASGVVEHQQLGDGSPFQEIGAEASAVRPELDGKMIRLPGYMTPLNFEAAEVNEFLLVPYVGACVHVPPPPANQIVYVTVDGTVPVLNMWDPMVAVGTLRTQAKTTELAEVGYTMNLTHLELYEPEEPDIFDDTNGAEPPPATTVPGGSELGAVFDELGTL